MSSSCLSSGDSSSPVEEEELELGLGLGPSDGFSSKEKQRIARVLNAQDFPSLFNSSRYTDMASLSASSSSSSPISWPILRRNTSSGGVKRPASSIAANNSPPSSQVVGWPPIRTYRMNSMANQAKPMATEEFGRNIKEVESCSGNEKCKTWSSFVKVYMDGVLIGRKIDLSAQGSYEKLAQTLEDMFFQPNPSIDSKNVRRHLKLMNDSSEYMLVYEDKEGDWMLVGDVPWRMFISSVKRLKITRPSETFISMS